MRVPKDRGDTLHGSDLGSGAARNIDDDYALYQEDGAPVSVPAPDHDLGQRRAPTITSVTQTAVGGVHREEEALGVLLSLTERLAGSLSLEVAMRALTDAALELLPGNHSSVRLLNERRTELLSSARSGSGADSVPPPFRCGQGIAGWVVNEGRYAYVEDTRLDSRFEKLADHDFEVRSVVAVPLWSGGQVVGVLSVSASHEDAFDEREVLLARLLANCASPAFDKARLERLAVTDPNTKSFNRRYLMPRLEHEIARCVAAGCTFSILMMDLDHFKCVNDIYGHGVGDSVLGEFTERVRAATRRVDELVRWGGEEFVLIMPAADAGDAVAIAERVRAQVAEAPFECEGAEPIAQTVSIGVATWDRAESPRTLEKRADDAMYAAKHSGRNQVVV